MSYEVEQAVLGSVLNNSEAITGIATLPPADFFEVKHQVIWSAILGLWSEDKPIDAVSVHTSLQGSGDAARVGGAPYLFELLEVAALPAALPSHVHTIKDAAAKRRLVKAGHEIQQLAEHMPAMDALAESQQLLDGVLKVENDGVQSIGETLDATLDHVSQVANGDIPEGMKSGLYDLDHITGGFRGGQMIIVAARPGVGKARWEWTSCVKSLSIPTRPRYFSAWKCRSMKSTNES